MPQLDENEHLTPQDIEDILNESPFAANNNAQNELLDGMPLLDRLELLTNQTVHTSVENPTNGLIYSEKHFYSFKNKIHMKLDPRYEVKIVEPNHFLVNIQNGSEKGQIKNFMKEYLQPDRTYGIFFENDTEKTLEKAVREILPKTFSSNHLKIIKVAYKPIYLTAEQFVQELSYYHNQTHTGINESYEHFKKLVFTSQMKDLISNHKTNVNSV